MRLLENYWTWIGKDLHESPEVPNYGEKGRGEVLKQGMVLAVEPMVNLGTKDIYQHSDGWTITTADNKFSAHLNILLLWEKIKLKY